MAITKNPFYFLWVGAFIRLAARHKGFAAGMTVTLVFVLGVWAANSPAHYPAPTAYHPSPQQHSPPHYPQRQYEPIRQVTQYPTNTSPDCPGNISDLQVITGETVFNPKGCYFYSRGTGTVEYTGLFIGTLTVDLATGAGDTVNGHKVFAVRPTGGTAQWQYILCAGPKRNMATLDCS